MKQLRNILTPLVLLCLLAAGFPVFSQEQEEAAPKMQDEMTSKEEKENTVDVKEIVFGHIGDSYEWHITTWGKTHITIHYLLLFIVVLQVGILFYLRVLKRTGVVMKGFPSLPKEVNTKVNW